MNGGGGIGGGVDMDGGGGMDGGGDMMSTSACAGTKDENCRVELRGLSH